MQTVKEAPQNINKKGEIDMSTTIGGLSSATANSIRGYGGLASGLDRDTLIEGMTYGTTSKITAQQQKKQQLEWKQSAVQSITNLMIAFANKYTSSFSSSTNLFSSMFWGRSNITTTGTNSKYVSVSGTGSSAESVSIMGVKQLAQKAKWSSEARTSGADSALTTGTIDTTKPLVRKELIGESLIFKVGNDSYTVFLNTVDSEGNALKYDTAENAVESINKLLAEEKVGDGTLADHFVISQIDVPGTGPNAGKQFAFQGKGPDAHAVTGGTALEFLGFETQGEGGIEVPNNGAYAVGTKGIDKITTPINFAEQLGGQTLNFTYNGVRKDIKIADVETLSKGVTFIDGKPATEEDEKQLIKNLKASLQEELDRAFGKGRILVGKVDENGKVVQDDMSISFQTINVSKSTEDKKVVDGSATLTLNSGSYGLLGEDGVLNVKSGATNKLDRSTALDKLGLTNGVTFTEKVVGKDEDGNDIKRQHTTIKINDVDIDVYEDDTINSLMERINNTKEAGVEITYQPATDKFTFTSTENGASGAIKFGAADDANGNQLLENIFGIDSGDMGKEVARGQDAIVTVKYAGSDEEIDLYRDANTFTVDGLTINVKSEFGYKAKTDADGNVETDKDGNIIWKTDKETFDPVEITASVNTDSIVDAIKNMVEEYNAIIAKVNKEVSTRPDRDYVPLTSEQKKELTEDEIKLYEEKAKEGLLFGDSDLRTLSSDLRFVISGGNLQALEEIGITTSSTYSDNGKLSLDESKLRAALASDPEKVEKLFTGTATEGNTNTSNGLATNLKKVMEKYVETMGSWDTKGILIRKAGSEHSPVSITENYMYKQIAEINKQIASLQTKLETERDRYIKQFTSLETLISQMNSQSSWLAQMGGSY